MESKWSNLIPLHKWNICRWRNKNFLCYCKWSPSFKSRDVFLFFCLFGFLNVVCFQNVMDFLVIVDFSLSIIINLSCLFVLLVLVPVREDDRMPHSFKNKADEMAFAWHIPGCSVTVTAVVQSCVLWINQTLADMCYLCLCEREKVRKQERERERERGGPRGVCGLGCVCVSNLMLSQSPKREQQHL